MTIYLNLFKGIYNIYLALDLPY